MKYYLIAGEVSGDLHASRLMQAIRKEDSSAQFRGIGGEAMNEAGMDLFMSCHSLAYMGFIPVLLHARTILQGMKRCKEDITQWKPNAVILIDYPGFNLRIAQFVHTHTHIPVYYYISPKIWAWKEHRLKSIRRYVDHLYSILPFEVEWYKDRGYDIDYVGNPSVKEVADFLAEDTQTEESFRTEFKLGNQPLIAILAGSRRQELKDNLSRMLKAVEAFPDYTPVIAGAPGLSPSDYAPYLKQQSVPIVFGHTYALLRHSHIALVTSGTATLEASLFHVPQIVCYYIPFGKLISLLRRCFLHVPYISLVNLIAGHPVVSELVANEMNIATVRRHLSALLPLDSPARRKMLEGYKEMEKILGTQDAPANTARLLVSSLSQARL